METDDPHNLQRFVSAQSTSYDSAISELRRGRKDSHWIWYIFPQVAGLGFSAKAKDYAISSRDEAIAYLAHPVLGQRLQDCCKALLTHQHSRIEDIMGYPDDLKLRSSMTLFATVSTRPEVFQTILDTFYGGEKDQQTLDFLNALG